MSDAPWRVRYVARARRDLRRLDPPVRARVIAAVEGLTRNPDAHAGLRRLRGRKQTRLRVGDWRVIFELDRAERAVEVQRVLPRGRAYER